MLKISSIAADLAKETEGDWVDIAEWPGVRLKVRSINSKDYRNARDQRIHKLTRSLGRIPFEAETEPVIAKVAAAFLLTDWSGIADEAGAAIPYSPARAEEMLCDPAMRALVQQVVWASSRVGDRDAEFVKDAAKN